MLDQYGREINYIRVSVTDRCNLRCVYCMPKEGVEQVPHTDILTYDEIAAVVGVCADQGISRVKITGGEPLVRRGIPALVRKLKDIRGIEQVTLTTNGVLLEEQMAGLAEAGLDAVNISLDTLDKEMYRSVTGQDELQAVLWGLDKALRYPGVKVKINCVPLKGVNENQWADLAALARSRPVDVRFIEMMPIGLGKTYCGNSQDDVMDALRSVYGLETCLRGSYGNGPGVYVSFPGFAGKVGFISAISHKFCSGCNRVRLTAEGFLKPCLQYDKGADLRTLLRGGESGAILAQTVERTVFHKPRSHHFELSDGDGFEHRQMSRIGG